MPAAWQQGPTVLPRLTFSGASREDSVQQACFVTGFVHLPLPWHIFIVNSFLIAEWCFIAWGVTAVHSPVDVHLGCLQVLVVMKEAAGSPRTPCAALALARAPGVGLLGHVQVQCSW